MVRIVVWTLQGILALTVVVETASGELLLASEALLALVLCSLVAQLPAVRGGPSMLTVEAVLLLIALGNCTLGAALHLYSDLPYFDKFLHLVNSAVLAYLGLLFLEAILVRGAVRIPTFTLLLLTALVVVGISTIWELMEYLSDNLFLTVTQGSPVMGPLDDTMWDSLLGLGGALAGGWIAGRGRQAWRRS